MEVNTVLNFGNGIFIKEAVIDETSKKIAEIIKKELPEEAQCINVIDEILDRTKANIRHKRVVL